MTFHFKFTKNDVYSNLNEWWMSCMEGNVDHLYCDNNSLTLKIPIFIHHLVTGKEDEIIEEWLTEWCDKMDWRNKMWEFTQEWNGDSGYEIIATQVFPHMERTAGMPDEDDSVILKLTEKEYKTVDKAECIGQEMKILIDSDSEYVESDSE